MVTLHEFERSFDEAKEAEIDDIISHTALGFAVLARYDQYETNPHHRTMQQNGVDRRLKLGTSTLSAEYKADSRAAETGNAFIETISNDETKDETRAAGWALKSRSQALFYYIPPINKVLFASMLTVKNCLETIWIPRNYPIAPAWNRGYKTWGKLVPLPEFKKLCCLWEWNITTQTLIEFNRDRELEQISLDWQLSQIKIAILQQENERLKRLLISVNKNGKKVLDQNGHFIKQLSLDGS